MAAPLSISPIDRNNIDISKTSGITITRTCSVSIQPNPVGHADRAIQCGPAAGNINRTTIALTVADSHGHTSQETLTVTVLKPVLLTGPKLDGSRKQPDRLRCERRHPNGHRPQCE